MLRERHGLRRAAAAARDSACMRRVRVRQSDRSAARRPRPGRGLRRDRREPARSATGCDVQREYYVNDAGRQMDILATSVWLRYLETSASASVSRERLSRRVRRRRSRRSCSRQVGDRLTRPAAQLCEGLPPDEPGGDKEQHIDALIARARTLLGDADYRLVFDAGLNAILDDIRDDLAEFGVRYDEWFSERSPARQRARRARARAPRGAGPLLPQGRRAVAARDRLRRREGSRRRARERPVHLLRVRHRLPAEQARARLRPAARWCSAPITTATSPRLRAGLEAMGEPGDSLDVAARAVRRRSIAAARRCRCPRAPASSSRCASCARKSATTRRASSTSSRSNDQHLDFDLELAKSQSEDNPVYYLQYAHARVASVFRKLDGARVDVERERGPRLPRPLEQPHEITLMRTLGRYGEVVETAAARRAPQMLVQYLRELAADLHACYNQHKILVEDRAAARRTSRARAGDAADASRTGSRCSASPRRTTM